MAARYVTGWCGSGRPGHRADQVRCIGGATGVIVEGIPARPAADGRPARAAVPAVICHCPSDCHRRAAAELAAGGQLELPAPPMVTPLELAMRPSRARDRESVAP